MRLRSVYSRALSIAMPARAASSSASWTSTCSKSRPDSALARLKRAEDAAAGLERRDDDRAQAQAADEVEVLGIRYPGRRASRR